MSSERHPQRLLAYLDGELPEEERRLVEGHLADCTRCADRVAEHRRFLERMDAAVLPRASGGLWSELEPRLRGDAKRTGALPLGWAQLALLVLGLGLGAWAGWSMGEESDGGSSPELFAETSLVDLPQDSPSWAYFGSDDVDEGVEP